MPRRFAWVVAIGASVAIVVLVGLIALVGSPEAPEAPPDSAARPNLSIPEIADLDELDPSFAEAVREAVAAVRSDSKRGDLFGELGKVYDAHQYHELARQCYEIAQQLDPGTGDWPYYLAVFAAERGRPEDAARGFRAAANLRPDYAPVYLRLGDALLTQGRLDDAESAYRDLLERDPASGWGHLGLAKIARRRGQPQDAIEELEQASQLEPGNEEITYLMAMTYRQLGRPQEADPLLEQLRAGTTTTRRPDPLMLAMLRKRKDLQSLIQAANRSLENADIDLAESLYRAVLDKDPDHYDALHNLGLVYGRTGRFEEAAKLLQRAVGQRQDSPEAHHTLAMAYASLQQLDRAVAELEHALGIDDQYQPSVEMLRDLREHMRGAADGARRPSNSRLDLNNAMGIDN